MLSYGTILGRGGLGVDADDSGYRPRKRRRR